MIIQIAGQYIQAAVAIGKSMKVNNASRRKAVTDALALLRDVDFN